MTFIGAGIFITDGRHVLAGYQRARGAITGFGGKREAGERPLETAWRELFEELLGVASPADGLPELPLISDGDYMVFECTFAELERLLGGLLSTPYYSLAPRTVADLVFGRQAPADAEVGDLALLPLNCAVHDEFVADAKKWREKEDGFKLKQ